MNAYRILMFRGGALGDFILTLPAIRALRRAWPRVFIELVGRPEIAELALVSGLIDSVASVDSAPMASYFVPHAELPPAEKARVRSFDIVISCIHDPDGVVRSNLVHGGAKRVLCIPPQVNSGHVIDHWIKPLNELGICGNGREEARLDLPARFRATGRRRLREMGLRSDVVVLHPGSGSPKKNWPLNRFIALAEMLGKEICGQVIFMTGEADEAIVRALSKAAVRFPVFKGRPLAEAASVLSACDGYVGNDSGITHLAAALGVRTVALFGPTDAAVWGPRGSHVSLVTSRTREAGSMACIRVREVFECLRKTRAGGIT